VLELRSFDGSVGELTAFFHRIWRDAFGGEVLIPLWSEEELAWSFFEGPVREPRYLVAAYDGAKLVGTLFARPARMSIGGEVCDASAASWLTVDPEYRRQFVAPRLVNELARRHEELGARCALGFAFPSKKGMSLEFWEAFAESFPARVRILRRVGFFVRILDGARFAGAAITLFDRVGSRLLGVVQSVPSGRRAVRELRLEDVARCLALLDTRSASNDPRYVWSEETLAHQLLPRGIVRTYVAEEGGAVEGFINFRYLEMLGHAAFRVAVIDELVCGPALPSRARVALVEAALARMHADGAVFGMIPRWPSTPAMLLLRTGFVPTDLGYRLLSIQPGDPVDITRPWLHLR
jgi:GNAT superfamily N-acetyltransferase